MHIKHFKSSNRAPWPLKKLLCTDMLWTSSKMFGFSGFTFAYCALSNSIILSFPILLYTHAVWAEINKIMVANYTFESAPPPPSSSLSFECPLAVHSIQVISILERSHGQSWSQVKQRACPNQGHEELGLWSLLTPSILPPPFQTTGAITGPPRAQD